MVLPSQIISVILGLVDWTVLYTLVSISLNLEAGYAGIPNFGRVLAFLVGIIVTTNLADAVFRGTYTNPLAGIGVLLACMLASAIVGFIAGVLSGLPAVRLREDYLAIFLLCIAEALVWFAYNNQALVGGVYGRPVEAYIFSWASDPYLAQTIVYVVLVIALYYLVHRLVSSPFGRILKAIRENELVAEVFGRDVAKIRLIVMGIGGALAAIAGTLYTFYMSYVVVVPTMRVEWTFVPWLIVVLGGLGNNLGAVVASALYAILYVVIRAYKDVIASALHIPFDPVYLFSYVLFGILLIIIALYRPEGILPERPILTRPIKELLKQKRTGTETSRQEQRQS